MPEPSVWTDIAGPQIQFTCEVRSVPASNPNRFPVVFAMRATTSTVPQLLPAEPTLTDPIIVMLTYFRQEVPVLLLFYAYDIITPTDIYALIRRTSPWADDAVLHRLLYATQQHTSNVHSRAEALAVLTYYTQMHTATNGVGGRSTAPATNSGNSYAAAEDLLNANVLPHLTRPQSKVLYLAHLVGLLLNHMFVPTARASLMYDKDHMGALRTVGPRHRRCEATNKRIDVCGPLLAQQVRNALYRMRSPGVR